MQHAAGSTISAVRRGMLARRKYGARLGGPPPGDGIEGWNVSLFAVVPSSGDEVDVIYYGIVPPPTIILGMGRFQAVGIF